jgi:hypothetical protein
VRMTLNPPAPPPALMGQRHRARRYSHEMHTLKRHNTENSKQLFPEKELRGNSPNSYSHVSASDLNIPIIDLRILLQKNR